MSNGLIIDLFAGGGGASMGIEAALGRSIDIALNHNTVAMAVHAKNHPTTQHLTKNVWRAKPLDVTGGRPVDLLWASPDCTHHSRSKGGKPLSKKLRVLACSVTRWVRDVHPATVFVENVPEFETWGPLGPDGKPDKTRRGKSFRCWINKFRKYGYAVEWRVLDASLYGAPTKRRRLFIIARCDGQPIIWPEPTHGPGRLPLHTAAECIDWSLPCPSIFTRKRPLKEKTLWRIAQGLRRFVFESSRPFVVKVNHGKREARGEDIDSPLSTVTAARRGHGLVVPSIVEMNHSNRPHGVDEPLGTATTQGNRFNLVAPILQQSGNGERKGQRARAMQLDLPLGTVMATGEKHALVAAYLARHFGDPMRSDGKGGAVIGAELKVPLPTVTGRDHHSIQVAALAKFRGTHENQPGAASVEEPLSTISAGGIHIGQVRAFLSAYYGSDGTGGQELIAPMRTLTSKHRLGIVTIEGTEYQVVDIGFRMLQPHELARGQCGRFAEGFDMSEAKTKEQQVFLLGNMVCPEMAEALVLANHARRSQEAA